MQEKFTAIEDIASYLAMDRGLPTFLHDEPTSQLTMTNEMAATLHDCKPGHLTNLLVECCNLKIAFVLHTKTRDCV